MLLNVLRAEWSKLTSTKSFWWTTALFFVFTLVWAWLVTTATSLFEGAPAIADAAALVSGLQWLNLSVLMIQAIMVVTTEYRYNLQVPVYLATPKREVVAAAKLLLYAVVAAVIMLVGLAAALFLAGLLADEIHGGYTTLFSDPAAQRALWAFPLGTALLVLFSQGLALLLRQSAGSIAVGLILFWGIDTMVQLIPKIGSDAVHFSPFYALRGWLGDIPAADGPLEGNVWGYLFVFMGWGLALWILGVASLVKRDA
ncbi:ABC transporter permease [Corynebacterium lizhenjunii]|uniref:ABC transporter permease n=1 Tax=Corynebacterium lizhenjunii TaxID=2709394 RepID=UPI001F2B97C1|nr:ABC transporter permease [Corynebacterium lizhenjunii]